MTVSRRAVYPLEKLTHYYIRSNSLWTHIFKLAAALNFFFWALCFLFSVIIFDNSAPPTQPSAKQCSGKSIALTPRKWVVVYFLVCLTLIPFLFPRTPQIRDIIEDKSRTSTLLEMNNKTPINSSDSSVWLDIKAFLMSYSLIPKFLPGVKWLTQKDPFDSSSLAVTSDCRID